MTTPAEVNLIIERFFGRERGRIIATLARGAGSAHLDLAETAVQDALVTALEVWPLKGMPDNPWAWLQRVARNRMIDALRREQRRKTDSCAEVGESSETGDIPLLPHFAREPDDELTMMLVCCHPSISRESQVALILKTLCGLTTAEIAQAYLASVGTVTRRLTRGKQTLREHHVSFEPPRGPGLVSRARPVLDALYLMFNEGYAAHSGNTELREDICRHAIRLCSLLLDCIESLDESTTGKVLALLALMHLQTSRFGARQRADGTVVLLEEQDRSSWNRSDIAAGLYYLSQATRGDTLSALHLEASIAARHAAASCWEETDWAGILADYDALVSCTDNPVVAVHRSVAVAMVHGADAGLRALEEASTPSLQSYHLLHAVRADLRHSLGDLEGAQSAAREAIALTANEAQRSLIRRKYGLP